MTPTDFPQSNHVYGPPKGMTEEQVAPIRAFHGQVAGGNCDGADVVVVAWKPSPEEIEDIRNGAPVFLTCFGGLPSHMLTTVFPYEQET